MKNVLILFISGYIFLACNHNNNNDQLPAFKNTINLQHEIIPFKGAELSALNSLIQIGSYLIIIDGKAPEYMILIYNLENQKLYKIGNKGRGPGELGMAVRLKKSHKSHHFEVLDFISKKVLTYNIDSCIADKNYVPDQVNVPQNFLM